MPRNVRRVRFDRTCIFNDGAVVITTLLLRLNSMTYDDRTEWKRVDVLCTRQYYKPKLYYHTKLIRAMIGARVFNMTRYLRTHIKQCTPHEIKKTVPFMSVV